MPAKLDEITAITEKYEIPVIEDAAEAIGSKYNGRKLGSFGDLGIYSFNGNKIITTSGGGALVSKNELWIQKARFLATQAREPAPHYQHAEIGYNYRLSNVSAGIGRGQLQVLDERVMLRRSNFLHYKKTLESVEGISFPIEASGSFSNRWLTTILIDSAKARINREDVRLRLQEENIETRPLWKPMHLQPVFKGAPAYTSGVSEELFDQGLCLPSGSNLSTDDLELVTDNIISMVGSAKIRQA
jgi:dTDP-4-amino-4,6-dideoxygalactose transaminase